MTRILRENYHFIKFIDVSVSNYGTDELIILLQKASRLNFNAKIQFLQGNYSRSLDLIKASQEILRDAYHEILSNIYERDTELLLNLAAPIILQTRDRKGELFLKKGYENLSIAREYLKFGFNSNRFLFSNRIRYYIDGIKRARQGKKFAFLALIESKTPREERAEYQTQTLNEALNPEAFKQVEKITDYERIRNKLKNLINQNLIPKKLSDQYGFFLQHDDNYGYISGEKRSINDAFFKNLTEEVEGLGEDTFSGEFNLNKENQVPPVVKPNEKK